MAEEFTAKFKVDISDLKKNISEANKQIKLANATFKSETAGMENWSKNADGLSKKLEQLKSVLTNQKTVLSSYKEQLEKQKAAYEENGKRADQLKTKLQELANNGVKKTDEEYKNYQASLKSVLKEQENNAKAIDDLNISILEQQGAVNKTEADIKKYGSALDDLEQSQRKAAEEANRQKTAYEELKSTIDDQQSRLDELKKKYADVVLEQGKNSDAAKELAGEIDGLSSELAQNKRALNEADSAADELDNSLDDLGDSAEDSSSGFTVLKGALANLVAEGIRRATDAIKEFVKETIKVGQEFDSSMSQVAAVSGATGDELEALRDKAKEMGANTKFSASEAADAFNYMAMAGWKTEDMLSGIEGILNLAAAGNTDLATTSDIVTDALTAFGQSAGDAGRLADIMAAASSNANTNVEMMGETFKYVAPVAGAMGYSMEDSAVAIGLMANAGIKGSQAGTALRSVLSRLAAPPKEAAEAMERLGIEITNTDGTMKPLSEVIDILRQKFDGLSEAEQTQYAKHLAGQEAMSGLLAIVNAAPADFDKLTDAVNNSEGAAAKMAETMQDNLGGDMTKLSSQFEGVQIALYEKLEPALRKGVEALSKLLDKFQWVIDHGETITAIIIGVGTAVSTFLLIINAQKILTGFVTMITSIKNAFIALNVVMAANPIGLVVAAIAGLIAAFIYLWNTSEGFRNFWIGLWEKIKEAAKAVADWFKQAWEDIINWFKQAWEDIKEAASKAWDGIKEVWNTVTTWFDENIIQPVTTFFSDLWNGIKEAASGAWNGIKEVWETVTTWFDEKIIQPLIQFFTGLWEGIVNAYHTVIDPWLEIFKRAWLLLKEEVVEPVLEFFTQLWEDVKAVWNTVTTWFDENIIQPLTKFFKDLWDSIKQFASDAWEGIKSIWNVVSTWFNDNIIQPVTKFFTGLWDGVKKAASDAWDGVKNVWKVVSDWFKQKITEPINKFFSDTWDKLKKGGSDAWEGIKNVFKSIPEWFETKFKNAWQKVKDVFSTGGKIFDGIKEGITTAFKAVVNAIIRGINKVIAIPFNSINSVLDTLRNISILGVSPFSWIGSIGVPQIPELARGGILRRGQMGLLEGTGAEAVVPLERNKQWISAVAGDMLKALEGKLYGMPNKNISQNRDYNFTQIINAPKQPSRIELYRQTRNLLSYANSAGSV